MHKKVAGILKKQKFKKPKLQTKEPRKDKQSLPIQVKFGKPILELTFGTIKLLTTISTILIVGNIIFSLKLFISSIKIRNHLGYYLNMISNRDGDILPSLQAVPVLLFFLLDVLFAVVLFKLFDKEEKPTLNSVFFVGIITAITLISITIVIIFVIISHSVSTHEELHSGIMEAMKEYSSNSWYKEKIDRLQIEFQCCGSKKYDEWYEIKWYDASLVKKGIVDDQKGNTPFSCCSVSSLYPCIHHSIEDTGKAYLYTPEQNLSISVDGCYTKLRAAKKEEGLTMIGNLILYIVLQTGLVICLRFVQTAHCIHNQFMGKRKRYLSWLFGYYQKEKRRKQPIQASTDESE